MFFALGQGQRNKTGIRDGAPLTMQEISKRQGIPIYIYIYIAHLNKLLAVRQALFVKV